MRRLNEEMAFLIAPLNSIFSKFPSLVEYMTFPWKRKEGIPSHGELEKDYTDWTKEGLYIEYKDLKEPEETLIKIMRGHGYLAQPDLRLQIKNFLAPYPYGKEKNWVEIRGDLLTTAKNISDLVKARHDKITDELDKLDKLEIGTP